MARNDEPIYVNASLADQTLLLKNQRRLVTVDAITFVTLLIGFRDNGWRGAEDLFLANSNAMKTLDSPYQMGSTDAREFAEFLNDVLSSQQEADSEAAEILTPLIAIGSEGSFTIIPSSSPAYAEALAETVEHTGAWDSKIETLAKQFEGATLAKLIQVQLKKHSEAQLLTAIRGTYLEFPEPFRVALDSWSLEYAQQNWIGPILVEGDLGAIFKAAISAADGEAKRNGYSLSSNQLFSMFNLSVLRLTHFAMNNRNFRKDFGIKKGLFG